MNSDMAKQPAENRRSIAQVNRTLRRIIEAETLEQYFWTGGRIQRFYQSDRGHCYFDLVDDIARIRCMLYEDRRGDIGFELENNLDVEVYGDVQFYVRGSVAQIIVRDIRLSDAAIAIKPAIDRLRSAGLYPPQKSPPPQRIRRIGCITGRSSRAIGDFETAYQSAGERAVLAPLKWEYVLLTGERAPQLIADSIHSLDNKADIDAIAIIRGGGRHDDFAAFESYLVAQAISQCQTFVVTGIGHQRDQTLSDQVADHAAATPTAAAHFLARHCLSVGNDFQPDAPNRSAPASRTIFSEEQTVAVPATSDFPPDAPSWLVDAEPDYPPEPPEWPLNPAADFPQKAPSRAATAASNRPPQSSNRFLNTLVIVASLIVIVAALIVLGFLLLRAPL